MERSHLQQRVAAILETGPDGRGAFIRIPLDVAQEFGVRGRLAVRGSLNGSPFRGSLSPYGGVHYLGINRALRQAAGINIGDRVDVIFELDIEPRQVIVPDDFAEALRANPAAQFAWDRLSYSHRREYVAGIEDARKPETRLRRIAKAIAMLAAIESK